MIVFILLLCCLCNASLLHLRASILEQQEENVVAQLKAKVMDKGCEGEGNFCGGIAAFPCPQGTTCVDDPRDDCDPRKGGSDCDGVCQCNSCEGEGNSCGGVANFPCPQGSTCVDDPRDDCNPQKGGSDCGGICQCNGGPQPTPLSLSTLRLPVAVAPIRLADGLAASTPAPTGLAATVVAPTGLAATATVPVAQKNIYGTPSTATIELVEKSSLSISSSHPNSILPQSNPSIEALLEKGDGGVISTTPITIQLRPRCCDPYKTPGSYPVPMCPGINRPSCCDGEWICPSDLFGDKYICKGVEVTGQFGSACPIKCCDSSTKPGVGVSPTACAYGAFCCYNGNWACADALGYYYCDGSKTKGITNYECPRIVLPPAATCCDPLKEPGVGFTQRCLTGDHQCCLNGDWACVETDGKNYNCGGQLTTGPFSKPCPFADAVAPEPALLDTDSEGADVSAVPSRDRSGSDGADQASFLAQGPLPPAAVCCPLATKPGRGSNPACRYSTQCCLSGTWACTAYDGSFACDGQSTSAPAGVPCPLDCRLTFCPFLQCPTWQQYTPTDECCAKCMTCSRGDMPLTTPDCAQTQGICNGGYTCEGFLTRTSGGFTSHGLCCPPDCSKVFCVAPNCAQGYQSWKPAGSCCPICKRTTCLDNSYPVSSVDCATVGGACPAGSLCQGFVVLSGGAHFSYGLCCAKS